VRACNQRRLIDLWLVVTLAIGCATAATADTAEAAADGAPVTVKSATGTESAEAVLRERANAYWNARVARSESVLEFYPPKELRPAGTIIPENGALLYKKFDIGEVSIHDDEAFVLVNIETEIMGNTPFPIPAKFLTRSLQERWMRIDGTWFKQPTISALDAVAQQVNTVNDVVESPKANSAGKTSETTPETVIKSGPGAPSQETEAGSTP
jgi:hypothetical protein